MMLSGANFHKRRCGFFYLTYWCALTINSLFTLTFLRLKKEKNIKIKCCLGWVIVGYVFPNISAFRYRMNRQRTLFTVLICPAQERKNLNNNTSMQRMLIEIICSAFSVTWQLVKICIVHTFCKSKLWLFQISNWDFWERPMFMLTLQLAIKDGHANQRKNTLTTHFLL